MFIATCVEISYNKEVNLARDVVRNCWLLNSGATVHICTEVRMMEDKKQVSETVMVGNGTEIVSTVSGTVTLTTTDEGKHLKLTDVPYAPELKQNIISVYRMIDKGHQVIFEDDSMTIRNKSGFLTCKTDKTRKLGAMSVCK